MLGKQFSISLFSIMGAGHTGRCSLSIDINCTHVCCNVALVVQIS